jgi:hypothetical protein
MTTVNWTQVARWRAHRHSLDGRAPAGSMLGVAGRICGLHAQVMSSAELAVWARVEGVARGEVQGALWEERTLVKTWAMRGTLHLLPTADLPMWYGALARSRRYRTAAVWKRILGISLEDLDRVTDALGMALRDRVLTREELVREVGRATRLRAFNGKVPLNGWGTVLKPAAFSGRLCFAPSVGARVRFTSPETWLPRFDTAIAPDAAVACLMRRYFGAYGPATTHDFARWWGGNSVAEVRRWIAALGEEVTAVELGGESAWMLAADVGELRGLSKTRSVRLLPGFDPYVVAASRHAGELLPGDFRARIYRPQGWISPVLLVNGRMEGVWRHELKGSALEVTVEPFGEIQTWARRGAAEEAERLAVFFGGKLKYRWKS